MSLRTPDHPYENKRLLAKAAILFSFLVVGVLTVINYINQSYPLLYVDYITLGINGLFVLYFLKIRNELFTASKLCIGTTLVGIVGVIFSENGTNGSLFWPFISNFFVISFFGHRLGTAIAALFYITLFIYLAPHIGETFTAKTYIRFTIAATTLTAISAYYEYLIRSTQGALSQANEKLQSQNAELIEALSQVKELTGLLPICANCHSVRDDNGYWKRIESYICEHTEATLTHSLCPTCAVELYPDLYKDEAAVIEAMQPSTTSPTPQEALPAKEQ